MKMIIFTTAFMLILNLPSFGASRTVLAVMDFEAKDIARNESVKVSELIRNEMVNSGEFLIVERNQVDKILREQGFQMSGCTDLSCAVQVGKLLSARKILVGSVMMIGEKIIITGRLVDVEKGVAEYGEKEIAESREDLYYAVERFCDKLTQRITGKTIARKTEPEIKKKKQNATVKYYTYSTGEDNYSDWGWTSLGFGAPSILGFAAGGIYYQTQKKGTSLAEGGSSGYYAMTFFNPGLGPLAYFLKKKDIKHNEDLLKIRNYIFIGAGASGGVSLISLIIWGALFGKSNMADTTAKKAGDIALYMPPLSNLNPAGLRSGAVSLGIGIKMFF